MDTPDYLDELRAMLRRWRPCVPPEAYAGKTAKEWCAVSDQRAFEIATLQRAVQDRDRTISEMALKLEQLVDNIRDIRELTKREGV